MSGKNKTARFIFKKSLIVILVLAILSQVIYKLNMGIFLGLMIGYVISVVKLMSLSDIAVSLFEGPNNSVKKISIKYVLEQIAMLIILLLAITKSVHFFFAVFIGISTVTMTILINSFTEFMGITKNNFE